MSLKTFKPYTKSSRGTILVDRSKVWKGKPYKPLTSVKYSSSGRNNQGRITARNIGGGHKQKYRIIDFYRKKKGSQGEVEIIEELAVAYNAMDVESFSEYFAEEVEFKSYDGKTYNYKKSDLSQAFKPYKSIDWKLISIVPLKIFNTDAASGAMVLSTESRVFKNGKKWKKELMELIYFDLEGKISAMLQFAR